MSAAEGGRCSEDSSYLTVEDIDAALAWLRGGWGSHVSLREAMYFLGPESFEDMSNTELLAWLESIEAMYGEEAAIDLGEQLNLADRLEGSGLNPEYVAKIRDNISKGHARVQAKNMIVKIGILIGEAADQLVEGTLEPVPEAPHMEPDLVWNISRAYWHEIVHRGMELGHYEACWIKGIKEFPYDEVLMFAQHIWEAFKRVTLLDFTVPAESRLIKSWLSISEKFSDRETAPDVADDTVENKRQRLQDYIDYGGPSRALTEQVTVTMSLILDDVPPSENP